MLYDFEQKLITVDFAVWSFEGLVSNNSYAFLIAMP